MFVQENVPSGAALRPALAGFPDLTTVRAFRKERCAIRHAVETLRPAQVRGVVQRATRIIAISEQMPTAPAVSEGARCWHVPSL